MFLMIDNYDSFTYNLYALFRECGAEMKVIKNDAYIPADPYQGIIVSPGPSSPKNSGTTLRFIKEYLGKKPIFGVCLGMQSLAYTLGYDIVKAKTVRHGKVDRIRVTNDSVLFNGMPGAFSAVRYHSLAVNIDDKYITSRSAHDDTIMSIEDREKKFFGVQFHPESILSEYGRNIAQNFINFSCETADNKIYTKIYQEDSMDQLMKKVNSGDRLNFPEAEKLFTSMVEGGLTESQIAASLIAMKLRQETVDELAALVTTLNKHKRGFRSGSSNTVDTCGTGGDGKSTVNVSTAVSIILASLGHPVVKHGNAAQSGAVGSADILTALGLDIAYTGSSPEEYFRKHNFVFMMAPHFHPALKGIGKVRRELKVPTIFNLVGPLVNPADPDYQVIGISRGDRLEFIAKTIMQIGKKNITVYSSRDGYDEVSSQDKTDCKLITDGKITDFTIDPSDYFKPFKMPVVKNTDEAKKLFVDGLSGKDEAVVDIFSLNTALALKTMNKAEIREGFTLVKEHIASGKVKKKLDEIVAK